MDDPTESALEESSPPSPARKSYVRPALTELGSVEELTRAARVRGSPDGGPFGFKPRGG